MKKTVLFLVSAALFAGLFSLSSGVFAEVGDGYELKTKLGEICPDGSTEQCGTAKGTGILRVLASEDGNESGDGRFMIEIKGFTDQKTTIVSEDVKWSFVNDPSSFVLSGKGLDENENNFNIDMTGFDIKQKEKKTEMTLQITLERVSDGAKFTVETSTSLITSPLPPGLVGHPLPPG